MKRVASAAFLAFLAAGCDASDQSVTSVKDTAPTKDAAVSSWQPPAVVETPEFVFTRQDSCDSENDLPTQDVMTMSRVNGLLELSVEASLYCSSVAAYPEISFLRDLVTVAVEDYSLTTDGTATACMCTNVLHFKIKREVPKGTRIVFLNDGKATIDNEAP